ncbi:cytochrome P450 [Mycena rebaudengoi]|nr:cytochrome P450 [Mycena rebaudengoi]
MVLFNLIASVLATLGAYLLYRILKLVYEEMTSPLRSIPGPIRTHWFRGNFRDLKADVGGNIEHEWSEQYGRTFRINGILGLSQVYTRDTKALNHILSNSYVYQKSVMARVHSWTGCVLVVEEDVHKQQVSPQIRELTEIFIEKSIQLRDVWLSEAAINGEATFDIIGLAGFNYKFNTLNPSAARDEFGEAWGTLISSRVGVMSLIKAYFPIFGAIPTKMDTMMDESHAVTMRIGRSLLLESKKALADSGESQRHRTRDLLSLLVRANTAKDIAESQRLSDEDVIAQIRTFLIAGHDTTSTVATWALFALSKNVAVQKRLRDELLKLSTDNPTMDELNSLAFLDCVVRETLRLHAPVRFIGRIAMRDDVIPLGTPYTDVNGTVHESLRILKGQELLIPILAIWGPDALDFKPERWEASTPISNSIPGVWGHMLTFLGGPRGCLGYRFALIELKALLFTLVRGLEFELAVPAADIGVRATAIIQRPIVLSNQEAGVSASTTD